MALSTAPFSDQIGKLNALGTIPPNTFFHESRENKLITTGGFLSNIPGGQTVVNFYKGRSPKETANQVEKFSKDLLDEIKTRVNATENGNEQLLRKTFRQIIFVTQNINLAIEGRVEGWGLSGAVKTYEGYSNASKTIETAIDDMKKGALQALQTLRDKLPEKELMGNDKLKAMTTYSLLPKEKPECPEEEYTDEEWEEAIIQSANQQKEMVGMMQFLGRYSTGLLYNQLRSYACSFSGNEDTGWDWHNKIGDYEKGKLFLSALPIDSTGTNSLSYMKEKDIRAVLSLNEVFETTSEGYWTSPVTPKNYADEGIKHLQIPTPDCETIFFQLALRGVEFVHWCLSKGINIDVHCKAGRGRSFLIVAGYLIKYQQMSADDAFDHIKKMRPQSGFGKDREEWETLKKFEEFYLEK